MSDTVVIFPGYPYSCEDENYAEIVEVYRKAGFEVQTADIEWTKDLRENLNRADKLIKQIDPENNDLHIFGHSWGAVCALWASRSVKTESLLLASMTPEFNEDRKVRELPLKVLNLISRSIMKIAGRPGSQNLNISIEELDIDSARTVLFYGEKEYRWYRGLRYLSIGKNVADKRMEILPNSNQIIVPGTGHMPNERYLREIREQVHNLD